jgi:hypothetical protein
MSSDILIVAGSLLGAAQVLDVLLSNRHRVTLDRWATAAWCWLDDHRPMQIVPRLWRPQVQGRIAKLATATVLVASVIWPTARRSIVGDVTPYIAFFVVSFFRSDPTQPGTNDPFGVAIAIVVMIMCNAGLCLLTYQTVHLRLALYFARSTSLPSYLLRCGLALGAIAIAAEAAGLLYSLTTFMLATVVTPEHDIPFRTFLVIAWLAPLIPVAMVLEAALLTLVLALSLAWFGVVSSAALLFWMSRTLLLRLLEYPRGFTTG